MAYKYCSNAIYTRLTIKEIRNVLNGKITICGGIPPVSALKESKSDHEFEKYINEILDNIGEGQNLILSFADTIPPAVDFKRIKKVAKLTK